VPKFSFGYWKYFYASPRETAVFPARTPTLKALLAVLLVSMLLLWGFPIVVDVAGSPEGNTYYVSPNGDDSNPGTYERPWRTPGYASKQLQPGDTLIILGGRYVLSEYWEDMITPPSGREDAWITIRGEEGNRPVLVGRDNLLAAIELSDVSYVRIENLEITSDNGAQFREGVHASSLSHIVLKDLYIHHIDEMGIDVADAHDFQIIDCEITYCGFGSIGGPAGTQGGWRNVLIKGCSLSYSGHYYQGGPGPSPYDRPDGFGIEPSDGPIEIVDCIAEHNRGDGFDSKAEHTYIHNCIAANNFADGIKVWGDGSRVENCLVYGIGDGDATPTPWAGIVIDQVEKPNARFELINVAVHDNPERQSYPMYVQYGVDVPITLVMVNCIIANGQGEVYIGDSVTLEVRNCLFYRPGEDVQVYANGRTYTAEQIEAGELGEGCLSRDPMFVAPAWGTTGDYHLQPDSPCIDAGANIPDLPQVDLDGNPRIMDGDGDGTAIVDMGPYEAPGEVAEDTIPPVISNVAHEPRSPKAGEQVVVSARITDVPSGVESATLHYRVDGGSWVSQPMSRTDGLWSAVIPAQEAGAAVQYYIEAVDGAGNSGKSDIYAYTVSGGETPQPPPQQPSRRCIIATATYGSELAPEVQFLRGFRDRIVLSTFAGSQFMRVFNAWYYSFSPSVAEFIAAHATARIVMKAVLYPLIGILHIASLTCTLLPFNPELGVITAGLIASSLIGAVYFSPPAILMVLAVKRLKSEVSGEKTMKALALFWLMSVVLIFVGEITLSQIMMMAATASFVLTTLALSAAAVAFKVVEILS